MEKALSPWFGAWSSRLEVSVGGAEGGSVLLEQLQEV